MAMATPWKVNDFEKFDQSFKNSEITRLISALGNQEITSSLRYLDFFDPESTLYTDDIPYLPEIDFGSEKKQKARAIDLIPAFIESEFRTLKSSNLKKAVFSPRKEAQSMTLDLHSPQLRVNSSIINLETPSRMRSNSKNLKSSFKAEPGPNNVDVSPGKQKVRDLPLTKFSIRPRDTNVSIGNIVISGPGANNKIGIKRELPSLGSFSMAEGFSKRKIQLPPITSSSKSIRPPKKPCIEAPLFNLYPFPRGSVPSNELEIERKGLEISLREIKESESYSYSVTEVFWHVVSSLIEMDLFSALRAHYFVPSYDSLSFWQGFLISYSTSTFEHLLRVYFGKLHFFGRGEMPSTLNSCYEAGRTINLILSNIMLIPSLSKCRRDVFLLCLYQLPILIKALRHGYLDRGSKYPAPESITKVNQSSKMDPNSKKRPLGAFRLELATTLLNIMKLDEANELVNFKELPETLVQIVMVWFFEDTQNQLLQSVFHRLAEKILTKGSENAKIILCFRLGLVSMISTFTDQIFVNNTRITNFELDYETMTLFVKRICKLIKENGERNELYNSLQFSPSWKRSLLCYGLFDRYEPISAKKNLNSRPSQMFRGSFLISDSSQYEERRTGGRASIIAREGGESFLKKETEKNGELEKLVRKKVRSQSILRINTTVKAPASKKQSSFAAPSNTLLKKMETQKSLVIS